MVSQGYRDKDYTGLSHSSMMALVGRYVDKYLESWSIKEEVEELWELWEEANKNENS